MWIKLILLFDNIKKHCQHVKNNKLKILKINICYDKKRNVLKIYKINIIIIYNVVWHIENILKK